MVWRPFVFELFSHRGGHRAFNEHDQALIRRTASKQSGAWGVVTSRDNPGVRVVPDFVSAKCAPQLESELRHVIAHYGASHVASAERRAFYEKQMSHVNRAVRVNMTRATGRYELDMQPVCPWRYGDEFVPDALPPVIRQLGDKIASCGDFSLGPLRDVTVNARTDAFFRLDPHIDPIDDGPNVTTFTTLPNSF